MDSEMTAARIAQEVADRMRSGITMQSDRNFSRTEKMVGLAVAVLALGLQIITALAILLGAHL
jgi:hypothetical protein